MKVVLLQDVTNVGRIGEIVEVPNGYGRNFLIPKGMADLATRSVMRSVEFKNKIEKNTGIRDRHEAEKIAQGLQGATLTIGAQVGVKNRIHGEVTNQDVAQAVFDQLGIEIDRHKIEIERPIRSLGIFMLPVRISKGLEASITVEILEESELAAREIAAEEAKAAEKAAAEAEAGAEEEPRDAESEPQIEEDESVEAQA